MARIPVNGVNLHVVEKGSGHPIVFLHEFAGHAESWQPQVQSFARRYRCVCYNARGYPPSDVPGDESAYGQDIATADLAGVMDALGIARAHIVGLSMGAYTGLVFALDNPGRVSALVAASGGSGSNPAMREAFARDAEARARRMLDAGSADLPEFTAGPARVQLRAKNPKAYARFVRGLGRHSPVGSAYTMRRVQARRTSLYDLADRFKAMRTPTLLVVGDEDEACLDVNLFLKRTLPNAGLDVVPKSGHLVNLEEPALFNRAVRAFFDAAEGGTWRPRPTA